MYNLKWFSAAVLVSLTFKTRLMKKKPRNETGASQLCRYHANLKQFYEI
jgi:hypothetical protein